MNLPSLKHIALSQANLHNDIVKMEWGEGGLGLVLK